MLDTVTLEDVENFRKCYARKYNIQLCAMILHTCYITPKCFEITWFIPVTVIDILRMERALQVYKEFEVSRVEIYTQENAVCVYQTPFKHKVSQSHAIAY